MYNKISNFKKDEFSSNQLTNYIKEKMLSNKNRIGISCRKLATSYLKDTGNYVAKSTVQKIIRHNLGFRYLKTIKKSNFLITDPGICLCLVFIKTLIKSLIKGFELIANLIKFYIFLPLNKYLYYFYFFNIFFLIYL